MPLFEIRDIVYKVKEKEKLLTIKAKPGYKFRFNDMCGSRGDIINKNMPR
jgi:hypothetical protein